MRAAGWVFVTTLIAASATAAVTTWKLAPKTGEWIGAASLDDAATATICFSSTHPLHSRIVQTRDGNVIREIQIDGFAINKIQRIGPAATSNLFFVGGSLLSEYTYRLIRLTDSGVVTMWDAVRLPFGFVHDNAVVAMSDDGQVWGAAVARQNDEVEIFAGSSGSGALLLRSKLTVKLSGSLEPGYNAEGMSVVVISSIPSHPVLAVSVHGLTYIIQNGNDPVKAVLTSPYGGSAVAWQAATSTLWVHGGYGHWPAFQIPAAGPGRGAELHSAAVLSPNTIGGEGDDPNVLPLPSGDVAVDFRDHGRRTIGFTTRGQASIAHRIALLEAGRNSIVILSPSGSSALILPTGTRSSIAHVRTF